MEGLYYDPKHGGCLRRLRHSSAQTYTIDGVYGNDEPLTNGYWYAIVTAGRRGALQVDFEGKLKRRRHYCATYRARRIEWDDGNVWVQLYAHPAQLAPSATAPSRALGWASRGRLRWNRAWSAWMRWGRSA